MVTETDTTNGTVTSMGPDGQQTVTDFVRLNDRWIPRQVADAWTESKGDLASLLDAGIEQANEQANEQSTQGAMMAALFVGMANSVIEPLSAASTHEEFDAALGQAMQMAGGMVQGGAAGGDAPEGF